MLNGRRLLTGVVVASVLATILSISWSAVPPLSAAPPRPVSTAVALAQAPGPVLPQWSTAWATAPSSAIKNHPTGMPGFTFRNVVHTTAGGPRVRVRVSNRFGTAPTRFGHVTVALSAHHGGLRNGTVDRSDGTASAGTMRTLLFDGRTAITVPAGADALSDPIDLDIPADTDLLVSIWTPWISGTVTHHIGAKQTSFVSRGPHDDAADPAAAPFTMATTYWYYLAAVEVTGAPGTVVALGDSITDAGASALGANHRWPDYLATRLAEGPEPDYGVANSGISGNRLLLDGSYPNSRIYAIAGKSTLSRFSDDVLDRSGVRSVIILVGINDIIVRPEQPDPGAITAGLSQLAERARSHGLRVVGATLTPYRGWGTWAPQHDQVRQQVNDWIRAGGDGAFDAVADFDQAIRDPADPLRLRPDCDGGDHLHPNDTGNRLMAAAVPLGAL